MALLNPRWRIPLGALLLFAAGFLIVYGKVALRAGSWDYTITHDDEYAFWVIADGFAATPRSDANPFYVEHAGETNPILSYPMVALVGTVSRWLGRPALSLLPLWKIGAPFLAWWILWLALTRIAGKREGPAAAAALCVLVGTLLLHGNAQHTLFRFARPVDAIGPAAVWLTGVIYPERLHGRVAACVLAAAIAVPLLSPFHAVFCMVTTVLAFGWSRWIDRDPAAIRIVLPGLAAGGTGGLQIAWTVLAPGDNRWMSAALDYDRSTPGIDLAALLLMGVAVAAVVLRYRHRRELVQADKALLCLLAVEPLAAHVSAMLGHGYGFGVHRYYFLPFELLAIIGWLLVTIPARARAERRRWEAPGAVAATLCLAAMIATPETNFLNPWPGALLAEAPFRHSLLLLQLGLVLLVTVWGLRRGPLRPLLDPVPGAAAVAVFGGLCFAAWTPQLGDANRSVPFAGAHAWLAAHAEPGQVEMTYPPDYGLFDYAPLLSPVRVFYNSYASRLTAAAFEREYRKSIYFALYCGILDQPGVPIPGSLAHRLQVFRLDYILAARGPLDDRWRRQTAPQLPPLEGDLVASIERQLGDLLAVVYEDDRCVLWRLRLR